MQVPLYEIILLFYLRGLSWELNWKDSVPSVIMSASLPKTDTCERPFLCLIGVDRSPVQKSSLPLIETENIKSQGKRGSKLCMGLTFSFGLPVMNPHDDLGQCLITPNHIQCPILLGSLSSAEILEGGHFWQLAASKPFASQTRTGGHAEVPWT